MKKLISLPVVLFIFLIYSCNPVFRSETVQYSSYRINKDASIDSSVSVMLKPYSDSINKSMNDVLGNIASSIKTGDPENILGYFMTDAYLFMAEKKFNTHVDVAFMNRGGIRLNELPAGKITRGKIFELMPFDNLMVLQTMKGNDLKQFLDTVVKRDQLIASGMTVELKNKMINKIIINGAPLNEAAGYTIAISDYMSGNSTVLSKIPKQDIGYLQRDAIIEYIKTLTREGKNIEVADQNRIKNVE